MKYIDAKRLKNLLISGSRWVLKHKEILNDLNVYPVPDGDTGTNMGMTLKAAEEELQDSKMESIDEIVKVISDVLLLNARGNSGTILSQILTGFLKGILGKEKIYAMDVAIALDSAQKKAYDAVVEPVEGTILTVVRRVAEEAKVYAQKEQDLIKFLIHIKRVAKKEVEKTKETLPKLKEADVVDAGAMGFYYMLEGFERLIFDEEVLNDIEKKVISREKKAVLSTFKSLEDIKYGYCTEFVFDAVDFDVETFKRELNAIGDSMMVVQSSSQTKVHIHTNNPGIALELALNEGELKKVKIDNMKEEHRELIKNQPQVFENKKQNLNIGIAMIADTKEIAQLFIKKGADVVLLGGQSKNSSVKEISEAIKKVKGKKVYFLPNNRNIISAAKIAAQRESREVLVIETKSMLEGNYVLKNRKEKLNEILNGLSRNTSIEITKAIKNTTVDELKIKKNNYIGLINGKIKYTNEKMDKLVNNIYDDYLNKKATNLTIIKGKDGNKETDMVIQSVADNIDIEFNIGKQEEYNYYIYVQNRKENLPEIAIVTDSTSDLEEADIQDLPISIVPLKLNINGEYLKEIEEINKENIWKYIVKSDKVVKTSQPSPAEFHSMYKKLFAQGYKKIISIHISAKLSGTHQSARVAKNMIGKNSPIEVIESKTAATGLGHLVLEASKRAKDKEKFEDIVEWVNSMRDKVQVYFVPRDLSYLQNGGRIGKATSLLGGVLKMRPILRVENGEVHTETKALGDRGAVSALERILKRELKKGSLITYSQWAGGNEEFKNGTKIFDICKKYDKVLNRGFVNMGGVLGSHLGPLYGLIIIPRVN
ncbi:MAG: DegV family protein [Fusobacteriota bacterium]